ncbi:hypothetical protein E2562_036472 [Oryza meyeriana var. granulata]|uniref:Uncharacterized protein n=1 Tax=Oryza meyeriana var. granulata TaxID=110450 RepID=A0A6G1C213_9ORYZ|nr:hypothetical protein E2562_036472 [Oryza meyeriana var. granulata]KAF0894211.1 hypothetical protein E2562_036472 [Oryza meyeriana var. granulata]KAF0894212.1 hypothetical protein E2562_036472 [Oryza meyeriana var. granulata]
MQEPKMEMAAACKQNHLPELPNQCHGNAVYIACMASDFVPELEATRLNIIVVVSGMSFWTQVAGQ